jgi:hypothetical protein
MREAENSRGAEATSLFAYYLAKAEEKHITVIRDQVATLSSNTISLTNTRQ